MSPEILAVPNYRLKKKKIVVSVYLKLKFKKLEAVFALCERAQGSFQFLEASLANIAEIDTKKLIRDIDRGLQQMSTEMETIDRKASQAGARTRALSFPSHDSFS